MRFKIYNKTSQPIQIVVYDNTVVLFPNSLSSYIFTEETSQIKSLKVKGLIKIQKVG